MTTVKTAKVKKPKAPKSPEFQLDIDKVFEELVKAEKQKTGNENMPYYQEVCVVKVSDLDPNHKTVGELTFEAMEAVCPVCKNIERKARLGWEIPFDKLAAKLDTLNKEHNSQIECSVMEKLDAKIKEVKKAMEWISVPMVCNACGGNRLPALKTLKDKVTDIMAKLEEAGLYTSLENDQIMAVKFIYMEQLEW